MALPTPGEVAIVGQKQTGISGSAVVCDLRRQSGSIPHVGIAERRRDIQISRPDCKHVVLDDEGLTSGGVRRNTVASRERCSRLHQARLHLIRSQRRIFLQQQRRCSRDHRGGHAGPAELVIVAAVISGRGHNHNATFHACSTAWQSGSFLKVSETTRPSDRFKTPML
jgi:hypothetical protein